MANIQKVLSRVFKCYRTGATITVTIILKAGKMLEEHIEMRVDP